MIFYNGVEIFCIIGEMSNTNPNIGHAGIVSCNENFGDAYCIRKIIEFFVSTAILILAVITLVNIIRKQKLRQYFWIVLLIIIMVCCLTTNIIFCFYNDYYWLYAIQTYCYNLYYLTLVGYISKSYLLKYRQIINFKKFLLDPQNQKRKNKERTIFFAIFFTIAAIYTVILITSIILQIQEQQNETTLSHCQEIWYLCFEGGCLLLSFIVLLTLYKNQIEETGKICQYQKLFQQRQRGSIITKQQKKKEIANTLSNPDAKINNPLKSLWIWICLNVTSQLFNLIESILFAFSTPPECLIVMNVYTGSNILELFFVFVSMYLCFVTTLFYVARMASVWHKHIIDREVFLQNEIEMGGPNIELFVATNNQTPSNSNQ